MTVYVHMNDLKVYAAELIGTFILVFLGTGAGVLDAYTGQVSRLGEALSFGIVVAVIVYSIAYISHSHINPAVSIALAVVGQFSWKKVPFYILAQTIGALLGTILLYALFPKFASVIVTHPSGGWLQAYLVEFVMTGILMFVVMSAAIDKRAVSSAGAAVIGGVVVCLDLVAAPISGGSYNPARSLAPAIVFNDYSYLWLYLLGPTFGAVAGAFVYEFVKGAKRQEALPEMKTVPTRAGDKEILLPHPQTSAVEPVKRGTVMIDHGVIAQRSLSMHDSMPNRR